MKEPTYFPGPLVWRLINELVRKRVRQCWSKNWSRDEGRVLMRLAREAGQRGLWRLESELIRQARWSFSLWDVKQGPQRIEFALCEYCGHLTIFRARSVTRCYKHRSVRTPAAVAKHRGGLAREFFRRTKLIPSGPFSTALRAGYTLDDLRPQDIKLSLRADAPTELEPVTLVSIRKGIDMPWDSALLWEICPLTLQFLCAPGRQTNPHQVPAKHWLREIVSPEVFRWHETTEFITAMAASPSNYLNWLIRVEAGLITETEKERRANAKVRARALYAEDQLSLNGISIAVDFPKGTVYGWVKPRKKQRPKKVAAHHNEARWHT